MSQGMGWGQEWLHTGRSFGTGQLWLLHFSPVASCVALSKTLNFSEPLSPPLSDRVEVSRAG